MLTRWGWPHRGTAVVPDTLLLPRVDLPSVNHRRNLKIELRNGGRRPIRRLAVTYLTVRSGSTVIAVDRRPADSDTVAPSKISFAAHRELVSDA
jgi:hypothetical protein